MVGMDTLTNVEREYLAGQRLGRLATIDANGTPQNSPVGYFVEADGTIVVGGRALGKSRKFQNVVRNPRVALIVDDVPSTDPWRVRAVEIRGRGEALTDTEPPRPGMSREIIRIHPERIISWGLESDGS